MTKPNADPTPYGTIPLESNAFSCLSTQERQSINMAILNAKLDGKMPVAEGQNAINALPNIAPRADVNQKHPRTK